MLHLLPTDKAVDAETWGGAGIDSMIELSRKAGALNRSEGEIESVLEHAIRAVKSKPEYRPRIIELYSSGSHESWFDAQILERAFYNVVLNAAEATTANESGGSVRISVETANASLAIRAADDGPGIPDAIRDKIFDPFVGLARSAELGLPIAQRFYAIKAVISFSRRRRSCLQSFLQLFP